MGLLDNQTQGEYYAGNDFGTYQFVTLENVISAFLVAYVGEGKLITKVNRTDVQFHAMRAIQELSYDVFRSIKSLEVEVPATLNMVLPQDYVNYTKLTRVGSDGIERILYPTGKTSNPFKPQVDSNNESLFDSNGSTISSGNLVKNGNFIGGTEYWALNHQYNDAIFQGLQTPVTSSTLATLGDPLQGWFYGFNGNAVACYDTPGGGIGDAYGGWGIAQSNVPIIAGEKYKITYTLSGVTPVEAGDSPLWSWYIVDGQGNYSTTTGVSANGTYEETITAGNTDYSFEANSIFFRSSTNPTLGNICTLDNVSIVRVGDEATSTTWNSYQDQTETVTTGATDASDVELDYKGRRYGLDPKHAQANGTFFIDYLRGNIHFGSTLIGKTIVLHYISDGLGTDTEMVVHKFCEEACYKWIAHAILAAKSNIPEYIIQRFKKERFAETRKAKIRLSNIKMEEFTQVLKGLSKPIK